MPKNHQESHNFSFIAAHSQLFYFQSLYPILGTLLLFSKDFESHHGHCSANLPQLFADGGCRGSYFRWPPTWELGFLAAETFTTSLNWCDHGRETLFQVGRLLDVQANKQQVNATKPELLPCPWKQCSLVLLSFWTESNGICLFVFDDIARFCHIIWSYHILIFPHK